MKSLLSLMILSLSLSAFAQQTVELNNSEITVDAADVIVVRTSQTPKEVKLTMNVPKDKAICQRHETRSVLITSSIYCGSDVRIRRVQTGTVCTRVNPGNGECKRMEPTYREERVYVARTCMVPQTVCAQYATVTVFERDTLKIKFDKSLPKLTGSETDTFLVKADQKRYDGDKVVYDITAIQTIGQYKIGKKKVLGIFGQDDSYVIEEK